MRNWFAKLQISPWLLRKLVMLTALVAVGAAAFCWGRWQQAGATQQANKVAPLDPFDPGNTGYGRRVVAYMYGNIPVYREELGEYLIARFGPERLEFMINRKIVETEARKYNIYVTDTEVEERYMRDLSSFGQITEKDFVNTILRRFGKSMYEWKEDVIRPKLMMEKIVRPMVRAALSTKDLQEGFEARYGPKVACRMIVLDDSDAKIRYAVHDKAKRSPKDFLYEAAHQAIPNLASLEGKVPPIHKHFGDSMLEEAAFRLQKGEISGLIQMKDKSWVILMCEDHVPADRSVSFEKERLKLAVEMEELRVAQKIPEVFMEMRKAAQPRQLLQPDQRQSSLSSTPPPTLAGESASVRTSAVLKDLPPLIPGKVENPPALPPAPQPQPGDNGTPAAILTPPAPVTAPVNTEPAKK